MKKLQGKIRFVSIFIMTILIVTSCGVNSTSSDGETMVIGSNTWLLINEMNHFPEGYGDLPVDFINTDQMKEAFMSLGVDEDKIIIKKDNMTKESVIEGIDYISKNAKEDDIIILYVGTHGSWIRINMDWDNTVAQKWIELKNKNKLLIVDSCSAQEFTRVFEGKENSGVAIAVTGENELGWWGLEEEGLPILGSVWVKYFTDAINDESTDANKDGKIEITEAFEVANDKNQEYMKNEVFKVEEFLQYWHSIEQYPEKLEGYPNSVIYNNLDTNLILKEFK